MENPPVTYTAERLACKTLQELKAVADKWKSLAADGWRTVQGMTESDFAEYQRGVELESQGTYGGDVWYEKFKDICFPEILFRVSMIAVEYQAPWNHCFEKCVEQDVIVVDQNGVASFK